MGDPQDFRDIIDGVQNVYEQSPMPGIARGIASVGDMAMNAAPSVMGVLDKLKGYVFPPSAAPRGDINLPASGAPGGGIKARQAQARATAAHARQMMLAQMQAQPGPPQ